MTEGVILGTDSEALAWVAASGLDRETKEDLVSFIDNFPGQTFHQETDGYLDGIEARDGVTLPGWLSELRKTLAGMHTSTPARFLEYDEDCARFDLVHKVWYTFTLGDMAGDDHSLFMEYAKLYPIGSWAENDRSYLAVNLEDPHDPSIYEFAREDLLDNFLDGAPSRPDSVFKSYSRMLSRLHQFQSPDGDFIQAANM